MKNLLNTPNLLGTLLVAGMLTLAQSGFALKETAHAPFSPILVNGMPFYGSEITLDARGSLAVVNWDAINTQAKNVPFRAYLKRGDVEINRVYSDNSHTEGAAATNRISSDSSRTEDIAVINRVSSDSSRTVGVVEVSQVLAGARTGDKLIIEYGNESQDKVQRVIIVAGYRIIHWFRIPGQPGDGC